MIMSFVWAQNVEVDQQTNIRRRLERDGLKNLYMVQQVNTDKINMDIETDEELFRLLRVEQSQSMPVRIRCLS